MLNSLYAIKLERKRGKSCIFYLFLVLITDDSLRILFYYNSVFTSRLRCQQEMKAGNTLFFYFSKVNCELVGIMYFFKIKIDCKSFYI